MEQNFSSPWIDILTEPRDQTLCEGSQLMLIFKADGKPGPLHFQWYCNGLALEDQTANILMVTNTTSKNSGKYNCVVTNSTVTKGSKEVLVLVGSLPTDKVALLIGNQSYLYESKLYSSVHDVIKLSEKLQEINFKTFVFVDLTYNSMHRVLQWFNSLLTSNAYCFIYFAGHGFENGESYIVPIDAPPRYQSHHCFTTNYILQGICQRNLSLTLLCLDTCRKFNVNQRDYGPLERSGERKYRNVIVSHATTEFGNAYEIKGEHLSIYARYLSNYIANDECVLNMVSMVQAAMDSDPQTHGKQLAEMRSTLCEQHRKLTDAIVDLKSNPYAVSKSTDFFNIWKFTQKHQNKEYILEFSLGALVQLNISLPAYNILKVSVHLKEQNNGDMASVLIFPISEKDLDCKTEENHSLYFNCMNYSKIDDKSPAVGICIRLLCANSSGKICYEDFEFQHNIPIPLFHTM